MTADQTVEGQLYWIPSVGTPVQRTGTAIRPPHGTQDRLTPYYVVFTGPDGTRYECDGSLHVAVPR